MAELKLCTENSYLSNFADDTQSMTNSNSKENLLEITSEEANSVVEYFASNDLVNNAEKTAALYNENGKGECMKIENIGGENIQSPFSEKLLGLHLSSDFGWSAHIEKISIDL